MKWKYIKNMVLDEVGEDTEDREVYCGERK